MRILPSATAAVDVALGLWWWSHRDHDQHDRHPYLYDLSDLNLFLGRHSTCNQLWSYQGMIPRSGSSHSCLIQNLAYTSCLYTHPLPCYILRYGHLRHCSMIRSIPCHMAQTLHYTLNPE